MKPFDPVADLQARIRGNADEPDQTPLGSSAKFDPTVELQKSIREGQQRKADAAAQRAASTVVNTPPGDTEAVRIAGGLSENGTPITPEIVSTDKPRFAQELRAMQVYKAMQDAPLTAQWFASAENAQYARHDAERLAEIERMFVEPGAIKKTYGGLTGAIRTVPAVLGGAVQGAAISTEIGQRGAVQSVTETVQGTLSVLERLETNGMDPELRKRQADRLRDQAVGGYADQELFRALMDAADDIEAGGNAAAIIERLGQKKEDVTPAPDRAMYEVGTWIASRLQESLAAPEGTEESLPVLFGEAIGSLGAFMLTSALTGPLGSFGMATALGVDEAYDRAIGAGLSHQEAIKYSGAGAPAGFIQAISVEFLMRRLPIGGARRWSAVARDLTATAGAEFAVESLGAIMQNVNQQRYDPTKGTFDNTLAAGLMSGSAAATLRGLMLTLAPGARRSLFRDIERMERSTEIERTFTALQQGLEGSELREAVPERFRSWADSVTTGTPLETVYVSPEGLQTLAQSLQDPALVKQIIEALPGVTVESYEAALRDGLDLAIPMSTWMTDVIGTEVDATLMAHVRFNPDEMTTFERIANATKINEDIIELRNRIKKLEGDGLQSDLTPEENARLEVFETARSAIAEAGFTASAAEAYAAQYSAFFARTAERAKMPIENFLNRFPLANINIDGTLVSMQRAPTGTATMADMLADIRDPAVTSPMATQARATLEALGVDATNMTDEALLAALQADTTLEQESAAVAPGSRSLGRLLSSTAMGRGTIPFVPAVDGGGPTAAALPTSVERPGDVAPADVLEGDTVPANGLRLLHGSPRADMNTDSIEIIRTSGQKQGKRGRVYGGFYATAAADEAQARGYAAMGAEGGAGTLYELILKPGTKVLRGVSSITRLSQSDIDKWVAEGYGAVEGLDPRGRTEFAIIDRNAVASFAPEGTATIELNQAVDQLAGLEQASPGRVEGVREVATKYMQAAGLPVRHQARYVTVNVERAREIARLYDEAVDSPNDPEVKAAYEALAAETIEQYKALLELGMTFEWITGKDPYATPADAIRDMQENNHLWVFPTMDGFGTLNEASNDNPLLAETEFEVDGRKALVNDLFRIVHDVFGHGSEGASFGPRGEENAWQAHVRMFTPLAARAMTSETRGQNSWVNYGPFGEQNRRNPGDTVFADQKTVLLPEWVSTVGQAEDTGDSARARADRPQLTLTDDGMVEMHHWSNNRLSTIDPAKAGTGPLTSIDRTAGQKVSYFGLNVRASRQDPGTGYIKENGLGPYHHVTRVDPARLYPWYEDPDGLKVKLAAIRAEYEAPKETGRSMATGAMEVQWYTQLIRDAGYLGYYITDNGRGSAPLGNVAMVFEALEVEVLADDDTGQVLFQSETGDWYFSALTVAVEGAKQERAMAKDWMSIIPKMPGVKKAEIEWTGVLDWLAQQEGQVERSRIVAYLRAEAVQLEEVRGTEGGPGGEGGWSEVGRETIDPDEYYLESEIEYYAEEITPDVVRERGRRIAIRWADDAREELGEAVQYLDEEGLEQYIAGTLETFMPDLLDDRSVPTDLEPAEQWVIDRAVNGSIVDDMRSAIEERAREQAEASYYEDPEYDITLEVRGEYYTVTQGRSGGDYYYNGNEYRDLDDVAEAIREETGSGEYEGGDFEAKWESYTEKGSKQNYREVLLTMPALPSSGPNALRDGVDDFEYDSHYDVNNVLVTARVSDRQRTNNGPYDVLFVEEVQSDLASEWRKAGGQPAYLRPQDPEAAARKREYDEANAAKNVVYGNMLDVRDALRARFRGLGLDPTTSVLDIASHAANTGLGVDTAQLALNMREDNLDIERAQAVMDAAARDTEGMGLLLDYAEARTAWRRAQDRVYEAEAQVNFTGMPRFDDRPFTPFEDPLTYEVMMKRMLNEAATGNYAALAWTPGYMQAQRWSGAVQNVVNEVRWTNENILSRSEAEIDLDSTQQAYASLRANVAAEIVADRDDITDDALRAMYDTLDAVILGRAEGNPPELPTPGASAAAAIITSTENNNGRVRADMNMMVSMHYRMEDQRAVIEKEKANPTAPAARQVTLMGSNGEDVMVIAADGTILSKGRGRIPPDEVVGKNLSELIGAQMTATILAEPAGQAPGSNIVIGGDGYKIAYDQVIKKFIEKFAKKYGAKVTIKEDLPALDTRGEELRRKLDAQSPDTLLEIIRVVRGDTIGDMVEAKANEVADEAVVRARQQLQASVDLNEARIRETRLLIDTAGPDVDPARQEQRRENLALLEYDREGFAAQFEIINNSRDDRYQRALRVAASTTLRGDENMLLNNEEAKKLFPHVFAFPSRHVWYVEITDAMREAASQPQPLFQNNRGSIILPPRNQAPTINLFAQKDLSTLLHEMGHQYLYILQQLSEDNVTSGGLGEDWQTINRWWGQNADGVAADASRTGTNVSEAQVRRYLRDRTTGDGAVDRAISVGLQEQWARGIEKYLMEGRSPSLALRGAFQKFKAWLTGTYISAKRLNVSISPEMTDVFDRLFATESELALAREDQGMGKLSGLDAESMGIDQETYDALLRLQEEAVAEQEEKLLREIMAPLRRQKTEEYRAERAGVEARVRADITARKEHRLREWLGNGRWLGAEVPEGLPAEMRFDREELVQRIGEAGLKLLPRGKFPLYSRKGEPGMALEEVANWFGFSSADQMLTTVQAMPNMEAAIAAETDAEMKRRGQDPMLDDGVEQAAIDALHGDKASQLLIAEMRALSKAQGVKGKVTPRAQAREVARRTLASMPVREAIRSGIYQAAERRAATEATEALAKGDRQAAFNAKQRQLVNHMLYSESRKVVELVTKVENLTGRLKRKGTRENLAGDYLEAIDEILSTYEFRRVSNRTMDRRGALASYIKRMTDEGRENELSIPENVREQAERVNYKQLEVTHLEGVYDTLVNIVHTARRKKKLTDAKEKREFDEIIDEILSNFAEHVPQRPRNRTATDADRRRTGVRQYLNLILTATTILRKIDGGNDRGAAIKNIKARVDEATRTFGQMNEDVATKLEELYSPYSQMEMRRLSVKKRYDFVNADLSHWDIVSIALNMGNVDNLERLTDPAARGFTRAQVDKLVSQLDQRDLDFVQGMWDLVNSYWPLIAAREKRLTGVVPKKVEAVPLEINGRTLRGGYYPIVYDGELSGQVTDEQSADMMKNIMPGKFGKAQTANGHLEARKNGSGGRPLMIDISVAHRHLGKVIHDLAYSEAISSSWRILQDNRLRGAFQDAGLLEDLRTLELWLQDVATGQMAAGDLVSRVSRRVKSNFTLAKLGFNISTVMVQMTGIAQSVVVVGKKEFAMAAMEYAKSPRGVAREVASLSRLMRTRETTFNKDINDILGDITRGPTEGTYQHAMRKVIGPAAFFLMQKVQYYGVDLPTWVAAYRSGTARGMSQPEAVAFADESIIRAQAGGEFADRSAFERGTTNSGSRQSDFIRLFTTLGSYMFAKFNVAYERTGRAQRVLRDEGLSTKSAVEVLSYTTDMALLIVLESLLYAAIMGRLPDDEDEDDAGWALFLARETGLGTAAMLPFVRDLTGPLQGFAQGGAYGGITETLTAPMVKGMYSAESGEISLSMIKSVVNALGLATGLPSTASNRVIDGLWRESEGDDVSPIEFLMGRR